MPSPRMFIAAGLLISASAQAVDPWSLPLGVWFDVVECLSDGSSCTAAGSAIDDPAWSSWLLEADPGNLDDDQRFIALSLGCADADGLACQTLGAELMSSDEPALRYRGAMLKLRACGLGQVAACGETGAASGFPDTWNRLSDGTFQATSASAAPDPETGRALSALVRAADKKSATAADLLDLGRGIWRGLGDVDDLAAAAAEVRAICDKSPDSAACALADDLSEPDRPYDPRLLPSADLLEALCTSDEVGRACQASAGLIEVGRSAPFGTFNSRIRWHAACDESVKAGCDWMTHTLRSPVAVQDRTSCDRALGSTGGDARACGEVEVSYRFGVGVSKDVARADELLNQACRAGSGDACLRSANKAWDDEDFLAAWSWYDLGCTAGDPIGCSAAGRLQFYGQHGIARDVSAGLERLRKGYEGGHPNAALHLGNAYADAAGVSRDDARATSYYLSGCARGDHWSCGALGSMVLYGYSTVFDKTQAISVLQLGCELGDVDACWYLGDAYDSEGSGFPKDAARARWAFEAGCKLEAEEGSEASEDDTASAVPSDEALPEGTDPNDATACQRAAALGEGDKTRPTSAPLPGTRPPASARYEQAVQVQPDGPIPRPGPGHDRPGPTPVTSGAPGIRFSFGAGSARSWSTEAQASSLRLSLMLPLGPVAVGADLDWVSDNRWRPKVARDYWRITGFINLQGRIGLGRGFVIAPGVGGGVGGYRIGPGETNDILLSYGAQEFLQFEYQFKDLTIALRLEQQQLFQAAPGPTIDHVTGIHGQLGVRFD